MTSDRSRHRLGLLAITALSLFGALFARLWFLQIVEGSTLDEQVTSNSQQIVITPGPRGRILDRNGVVLVENRETIVVAVDLRAYNDLDRTEQKAVLARLASALSRGRPPEDKVTARFLDARLGDERFSRFRPIPVAEDITVEQEIYFREQAARFPSVVVERQMVRSYPYGQLAAHVLGYVGALSEDEYAARKDLAGPKPYEKTDEIGKSGVERQYEEYLRGTPGRQVFEVDRLGRVVRELTSQRREPQQGDDLYLAIDARVQYKAEQALQGRLAAAQGRRTPAAAGALVVLDPTNGQVRAMASYPTYDPADLVGGISQELWADLQGQTLDEDGKPVTDEDGKVVEGPSKLLNRATAGGYPPASTFKLASGYAALKLGLIDPAQYVQDPGYWRLCEGDGPGCLKRNAGSQAHGSVDLQTALTVSSDVYFYRIGDMSWTQAKNGSLPEDGMQQHIEELGYGAKTGIDLPAESPGQVPTPKSEAAIAAKLFEQDPGYYDNDPEVAKDAGRWRTGYSADLAIGQKVTATPLQTANAYAALANGGTLYRPRVVDRITKANSPTLIKSFAPEVIRQIDWGPARSSFLAGFAGAVGTPGGTAFRTFQGFPLDTWPVAGKTGTAQTGKDKLGNQRPENSLFVGFSLGDGGTWLASAMLEGAGAGANAAAPAVRLTLEPIATGEIDAFKVPKGASIDAEAVAEQSSAISTEGSD
ncbi:MAG: penicillin-binding transpeptidase domain-containing protein [Acidimicrobiales bacterium]